MPSCPLLSRAARAPFAAALLGLAAPAGVAGCHERQIAIAETEVEVIHERPGRGRAAHPGDDVCIDVRVTMMDGDEVMRDDDYCFRLGAGVVIEGVDDAVVGMREGGVRHVECPPQKHWGRGGYASIPGNAPLILEIKGVSGG